MISPRSHLFSNTDSQKLDLLFLPSWLSGLVALMASLLVVLGAIGTLHYHGSQWELLVKLQAANSHAVSTNSQVAADNLSSNVFISDIPLFIFWAGIGLIAYSFTMAVIDAARRAEDLRQEVNYVHVDRQALLINAGERVALRVIVLLAWLLYINLTAHVILPYVVATAYAATGPAGRLAAAGYILWGTTLLAVCLHLHVVLLRLLALRPRLFGQAT